jgi:hypothetical protein
MAALATLAYPPRAVNGHLPVALAIALCLLACASAPQASESTALLCDNGSDDDGDTLHDCDDPDCWSLALCRVQIPTAGGLAEPPSASDGSEPSVEPDFQPGDTFVPTPGEGDEDGSTDQPAPSDLGDAASPDESDAATALTTDAGCDCDAGCDACPGVSGTGEALGRFEITRIAIRVPRAIDTDRCLDAADSCVLDRPNAEFARCRCAPDPQVAVYLDDTEMLMTEARRGADTATWVSPGLELDLYEGARLGFEVLENDASDELLLPEDNGGPATPVEHIFGCEVIATSAQLSQGNVECGRPFPTDLGAEAHFDVRVQLRKLAPGGSH